MLFGAVEIIKLKSTVEGDPNAYKGPVVILVNAQSASASELFAGAMQATRRARGVGQPTCGCLLGFLGYARVPGGGEIAYSEVGFVLSNGKRIEGEGVMPDHEVPVSLADLRVSRDRALEDGAGDPQRRWRGRQRPARWLRARSAPRSIRAWRGAKSSAWAMYDFANSGYTTVVLTAVFNAYFVSAVAGNAPWATFAWTAALSVSYLLVMLLGPVVGAWADAHAAKKHLLLGIYARSACSPPRRSRARDPARWHGRWCS